MIPVTPRDRNERFGQPPENMGRCQSPLSPINFGIGTHIQMRAVRSAFTKIEDYGNIEWRGTHSRSTRSIRGSITEKSENLWLSAWLDHFDRWIWGKNCPVRAQRTKIHKTRHWSKSKVVYPKNELWPACQKTPHRVSGAKISWDDEVGPDPKWPYYQKHRIWGIRIPNISEKRGFPENGKIGIF